MDTRMKTTRIIIAGGGFAGLYAAKHLDGTLARRRDIEVTLISRENFILFTPMLHEVAAGDLSPSDIVNPLRRILRHVKVVQAEIQAIELPTKRSAAWVGLVTRSWNSNSIIFWLHSVRRQTSSTYPVCAIGLSR